MAGCIDHLRRYFSNLQHTAVADGVVHSNGPRRPHSHPTRLNVQHFEQSMVILVHQDGSSCSGFQLHGSAYVVNVRMRNHDLLERELFLAQQVQNPFDLVSRVDHHGLMCLLIPKDGTVALQRADRKNLMDHIINMLLAGGLRGQRSAIAMSTTRARLAQTKAARRRLFAQRWQSYFFGVSTGVGTLSITEDEVCMPVR